KMFAPAFGCLFVIVLVSEATHRALAAPHNRRMLFDKHLMDATKLRTFKTSKGMARQILEDRRTERWLHRQASRYGASNVPSPMVLPRNLVVKAVIRP
ncbi:hypothetical protein AAVH_12759, partial [Aphelenchoides avenae]